MSLLVADYLNENITFSKYKLQLEKINSYVYVYVCVDFHNIFPTSSKLIPTHPRLSCHCKYESLEANNPMVMQY